MKRKPLSKRTRFEIFKRDGFVCQYCGNKPPNVVLEIDHINPVSKGGTDEIINLITSCYDCNRGKSDKDIKSVCRPDIAQENKILKEKLAQVKEYYKYKDDEKQLVEFDIDEIIDYVRTVWNMELTENGINDTRRLLKTFNK